MAHAASAASGRILFQEPQTVESTVGNDPQLKVSFTLALCERIPPKHITRLLRLIGPMSSQFVNGAYGSKRDKGGRS